MAHEFTKPIIGQEAICRDGLGRVVDYCDRFPEQWIKVDTYVRNCGCQWAPHNVKLISPYPEQYKAYIDMAEKLAEALQQIRDKHHVTLHGQVVISHDDVRLVTETLKEWDTLKEERYAKV